MPDLSPEAVERARQTVQASRVFEAQAQRIAAETPDLPEEHVLVAVVDKDLQFTGTHVVARAHLVESVPELEGPEGWAMSFSHETDAAAVRKRAGEMASIAGQRIEVIQRIQARRAAGDEQG